MKARNVYFVEGINTIGPGHTMEQMLQEYARNKVGYVLGQAALKDYIYSLREFQKKRLEAQPRLKEVDIVARMNPEPYASSITLGRYSVILRKVKEIDIRDGYDY